MTHRFVGLSILFALMLSGCITVQPVNSPGKQSVGAETVGATNATERVKSNENAVYELAPLDPIYIRFSGILDQQQLELVIDEKGEISLLHISEPIKAAGLTPSELAKKIERCYVDGGIYRNVSVSVTMTAKVYYLQGEVIQPGQFQLMSGTTLLQAIAGARGYTPYADKRKVSILRHGRILGTYNVRDIEKDPSQDVRIEAGDVIKVPQTWY